MPQRRRRAATFPAAPDPISDPAAETVPISKILQHHQRTQHPSQYVEDDDAETTRMPIAHEGAHPAEALHHPEPFWDGTTPFTPSHEPDGYDAQEFTHHGGETYKYQEPEPQIPAAHYYQDPQPVPESHDGFHDGFDPAPPDAHPVPSYSGPPDEQDDDAYADTRPLTTAWYTQPAAPVTELPESELPHSQVDNSTHLLTAQESEPELYEDEPDAAPAQEPGMAKRLAMGTFWQVISQFAPLMIGLLMTPIIISGMGKDRYSIFLLINGLSLVMSQFDGGIGQSALRFFTLNAAAGDKRANTRLLTTLVVLSTILMTVVFGALALNATRVLDFFKVEQFFRPEAYLLLVVMMVGTGAIVVRNLFNSVLFANHRFITTAVATVAGQVVYAIGMVWTLRGDHGLYGVATTFIVQQIVGTGITLPISFQYLDRRGVRFMSGTELKDFFRYSWKVQLAGLIAMLMQQKDQLAAGRILGGQSSGPYSQGTTFATQLRMMPLNAMGPMQAMIGHLVGENGPEAARPRVEAIQRFWIKAATGWFAIGIPAAYVGVQRWLPDSFAVTGTVAALLLLGYLFAAWSVVLMLWCLILGHSELDARYGMVALFSNLVLSAVAWFPFGIQGVVGATAVSWLIAVIFLQWDAARTLPVRIRSFWRDIPIIAAVVAGGGTMALELYLEPQLPRHIVGLFSAALVALPGVIVFALLAFSPSQLKQGLGMARSKLGR